MRDARSVWQAVSVADNDHDTSAYADHLSEDLVVHLLGGQELHGLTAYRSFVEALFVGMPDYHAEALDLLNGPELVMVRWRITGTHAGTLFGIPATGRALDYSGCSVWHTRDDRIVEGWMYPDRATMLDQLGITEGES